MTVIAHQPSTREPTGVAASLPSALPLLAKEEGADDIKRSKMAASAFQDAGGRKDEEEETTHPVLRLKELDCSFF